MTPNKRNRVIAAAGTIVVHAVVHMILYFVVIKSEPQPQDMNSGVYIQIGVIDEAGGMLDPYPSKSEEIREQATTHKMEEASETGEQEVITQDSEESIALKKKTEAEKRRTEEQRLAREEQKRREQQLADERDKTSRVNNAMQNAFGSGNNQSTSRGDSQGEGIQGSPSGNAPTGATQGVGGWGGFSLDGRKCLSLPKPTYNSNLEGVVVVEITVDKEGRVVSATVKAGSTPHAKLRNAALEAARKAVFDKSSKHSNQMGTITYNFKQQ